MDGWTERQTLRGRIIHQPTHTPKRRIIINYIIHNSQQSILGKLAAHGLYENHLETVWWKT